MLLRISPRVFRKNLIVSRHLTTLVKQQNVDNDYEEKAEYPPIVENNFRLKKQREVHEWHEKIKRIETIEEKLIEINIPRYYGHKCLMLNDRTYPYNTLPFFQYATNTEFIEESHVAKNEGDSKIVDNFLGIIKAEVQDALEFELDGYK